MSPFSKWTLFEDGEKVLAEKLGENPYHPFQEVWITGGNEESEMVFVCSVRFLRFYAFILLTLASLLFIVLWPLLGGEVEYLIFAVASLMVSVYLSVEYYPLYTVVLDTNMDQYSVYRGEVLVATQHCHNIYIRLMSKSAGGTKNSRYYLILNGWGLPATIELCRETANKKELRQLGKILASNLGINYFDVHDLSKYHVIRHNHPQTERTNITERHEE